MTDSAVASQPSSPQVVDIATVATLLGVGERYVRRIVAERRAPVLKVGRLVRFDLEEIRRCIEEQRRPPAADRTPRCASGHR